MKQQLTRTEYSFRNATVSVVMRLLTIFSGFFVRIIFTHMLAEDYVGVNGLFQDILGVLSLTELGIGTAITFCLYEPIASGDQEKIKALMRMFRNFYRAVALVVMILGSIIALFFDVIIKNPPEVDNLLFIYLLYLSGSVLSYLFIYKRNLIDASQQKFISDTVIGSALLLQYVLQAIVLVVTRNFILYLVMYIGCTILGNIVISLVANKMYPCLKDKQVRTITDSEKNNVSKHIKAAFVDKFGNVIINNTDNLILSSMVGIFSVAQYSNYYLLIGSVRQILESIFSGVTASVGNLGANREKEGIEQSFNVACFISQCLSGFCVTCLWCVLSSMVGICFGSQYIMPKTVVAVLCINFYMLGMRLPVRYFREALGLFRYDRYKAFIEAGLNIVLSIVLIKQIGVVGVFIGTMLSYLFVSFWIEPFVLYRRIFDKNVLIYILKYVCYVITTIIGIVLTEFINSKLSVESVILSILIRIFVSLIVTIVLYITVFCRTRVFKDAWEIVKNLSKKIMKRI